MWWTNGWRNCRFWCVKTQYVHFDSSFSHGHRCDDEVNENFPSTRHQGCKRINKYWGGGCRSHIHPNMSAFCILTPTHPNLIEYYCHRKWLTTNVVYRANYNKNKHIQSIWAGIGWGLGGRMFDILGRWGVSGGGAAGATPQEQAKGHAKKNHKGHCDY
jgi:hypothetical protein